MKKSKLPLSAASLTFLVIFIIYTFGSQMILAAEKKSVDEPIVLITYDNMTGEGFINEGTLGGTIPSSEAYTVSSEIAPSGKESQSLKVLGWRETKRSTFEVPPLSAGTIHFWLKPGALDEYYKNIVDIGQKNFSVYSLRSGILVRVGNEEYFTDNHLTEDEWIHFAFVFDTATNLGEIFINGEPTIKTTSVDFKGGLMAISATLDIAAAAFNGNIGAITILNRALSKEEVAPLSLH